MRRYLMTVLALVTLAFVASNAEAWVRLTKDQVNTVCGNPNYCQKKCGLNKEYTCEFGCGRSGCAGTCLTCPGGPGMRRSNRAVRTILFR
jgi:hypothetical protein